MRPAAGSYRFRVLIIVTVVVLILIGVADCAPIYLLPSPPP
jgi:hypothetical protein